MFSSIDRVRWLVVPICTVPTRTPASLDARLWYVHLRYSDIRTNSRACLWSAALWMVLQTRSFVSSFAEKTVPWLTSFSFRLNHQIWSDVFSYYRSRCRLANHHCWEARMKLLFFIHLGPQPTGQNCFQHSVDIGVRFLIASGLASMTAVYFISFVLLIPVASQPLWPKWDHIEFYHSN